VFRSWDTILGWSQLYHAFTDSLITFFSARPDYKKLSILRQLFPHVPILALSATCPPKVLQDILTILRMRAVVDGKGEPSRPLINTMSDEVLKAAPTEGTVYFSAPLYSEDFLFPLCHVIIPFRGKPSLCSRPETCLCSSSNSDNGGLYIRKPCGPQRHYLLSLEKGRRNCRRRCTGSKPWENSNWCLSRRCG
jgi:hypothetical protein